MYILPCRICNEKFEGRSPRAMYCSRRCKDNKIPAGKTWQCVICSKNLRRASSGVRYPMHGTCRSNAPQWMRRGEDDPAPALAAAQAERDREKKARAARLASERRSKIRAGFEDGNYMMFIEGIRERSIPNLDGCWEWSKRRSKGYPMVAFGGREMPVHRMVIEAMHGKPLGVLSAHHKCGNSGCVNPEHLQPVTQRENMAEMLARTSLEARIIELEQALTKVDPGNEALNRISAVAWA